MEKTGVERHKSGVYKITNLITNELYIGGSSELYNRFHTHKTKLKKQVHSSLILQKAYNEYGKESFLFEVLEYCSNYEEREQYYNDLLQPVYNKRASVLKNTGLSVSQEAKNKISNTLKEKYKGGLKAYTQSQKQKEVNQYTLEGEYIKTFKSPREAELAIGCTFGNISRACNKKSHIAHNYIWRYKL